MRYKAFISYSHAVDGKLAPVLQRELQGFAKPLFKLRSVSIFRDSTNLSVNPGLWSSIEGALLDSEFFLFMASEASASSDWVRREVETWLRAREVGKLLIVLTDGIIAWNKGVRDFDWNLTTALPPSLDRKFSEEPFYLDLRWTRTENDLSSRNPRFMDAIADITATLRQIPKDILIGEDVQQHRKLVRFRRMAVAGLLFLLLIAAGTAYVALGERNAAVVRQVSAEAQQHAADRLDLSCLLSLEANRMAERMSLDNNLEPRQSLLACVQHSPHLVTFLHGHSANVKGVKFSPSGLVLASYDENNFNILWDISRRREIRRRRGTSFLAFAPDDHAVAWAMKGKIAVEDLSTGAIRNAFVVGGDDAPQYGFFSRGGRELSVIDGKQLLRFDLANNKIDRTQDLPASDYFAEALDGSVIAVADNADLTVYRFGRSYVLDDHTEGALALSPDGKMLASGGYDGLIYLWNLENRKKIGELVGHTGTVFGLVFSSSGEQLVSTGWDGTVRVWDVATRRMVDVPFSGHRGPVYGVDLSSDGSTIASGGADYSVLLWDARRSRALVAESIATPFDVHSARAVAFRHDGKMIGSSNEDRIILQDLTSRSVTLLWTPKEDTRAMDLAFDPAADLVASAQFGGTVRLWSLKGAQLRLLRARERPLYGVCFSPDGKRIASVSSSYLTIWKVASASPPQIIEAKESAWEVAHFSPDGKLIAAAGTREQRGTVDLFDAETLKPVATLEGGDAIRGMAFNLSGSMLATTSNSGEIILWDVAERRKLVTLSTQTVPIFAVAFSPDGRMLATGGVDEGLTLWDLRTAQPLGPPLTGNGQTLFSAAFSPDGKLLATNGNRRGPLLWDVDVLSWKARACRIANRQLTIDERREFIGFSWTDKLRLSPQPPACR